MSDIQHSAPRCKLTVPVGGAYLSFEEDFEVLYVTAQEWQVKLESFSNMAKEWAAKHPDMTIQHRFTKPPGEMPPPAPRKSYCGICKQNGHPNVEIKWPRPFNERQAGDFPLEPDGKTPHVHKQPGAAQ